MIKNPPPTTDTAVIEKLHALFAAQKAAFAQNMIPSYQERIHWLTRLEQMILQNQERIAAAVEADFGTHAPELTRITELLGLVSRVKFAKRNLQNLKGLLPFPRQSQSSNKLPLTAARCYTRPMAKR